MHLPCIERNTKGLCSRIGTVRIFLYRNKTYSPATVRYHAVSAKEDWIFSVVRGKSTKPKLTHRIDVLGEQVEFQKLITE